MYELDIKLNSNCPASEKTGKGPGSCGGNNKEVINKDTQVSDINKSTKKVIYKNKEFKIGQSINYTITANKGNEVIYLQQQGKIMKFDVRDEKIYAIIQLKSNHDLKAVSINKLEKHEKYSAYDRLGSKIGVKDTPNQY